MSGELDKELTQMMEDNRTLEDDGASNVETPSEPKFDGLSNREALKKAISEKRDVQPDSERKEVKPEAPTVAEVKTAIAEEVPVPAEFSREGKEAWKNKDIVGIQKEFRRIHDARTQEIMRAQQSERTAKEDQKTYRDLAKMAAPYIEARGKTGVAPEKAILEALTLVDEFKRANPATVKAELKKIGINLDDVPGSNISSELENKINTIQERQDRIDKQIDAENFQRLARTFDTVFGVLGAEKTRTGDPVYPDLLNNSETGIQFARELGSLTQDDRFRAGVLRRFPDADLTVVVREAYKYLGGKVSGEPVSVSPKDNQKHIEKARRAAAVVPGRVAGRSDSNNLAGKLSNRAALARAIQEHREH